MNPEALILRRCYPVPVSFADLRAAWENSSCYEWVTKNPRTVFTATLKRNTGAIDEVYAVVDGREVRVATVKCKDGMTLFDQTFDCLPAPASLPGRTWGLDTWFALFDKADRAGYWERPHEVRIGLTPRPVLYGEAKADDMAGAG